jgi:uncharacterized protein (TIGR02246 family)
MSDKNKAILQKANAAIRQRDIEGFLSFCAEDIEWTTVGDQTLRGKEAVRQWMASTYVEPPKFTVTNLIAEGDYLIALGSITANDDDGTPAQHQYCDVWRFRGDEMAELRAFVIRSPAH